MRRRHVNGRALPAKRLVALAESLPGFGAPGRTPLGDQWHAAMRDHGFDAVDYLRARRSLRRR